MSANDQTAENDGILELPDGAEAWRENRGPKWYADIGYAMENVVRRHRYDYRSKGIKPTDPGWHACSCEAWEGYWSGFEGHVADHLRALIAPVLTLVEEAEHREATSPSRTFDGGSFGAWVDAKALREALTIPPVVEHRLVGSMCICGEWSAQCGNDVQGQWLDHVRSVSTPPGGES